jgi:membrane associated rhomboid family serine protease
MASVDWDGSEGPVALDLCRRCHLLWADDGEERALPVATDPRPRREGRDPRAVEAIARFELEHQRALQQHREAQGPDDPWKAVAGALGFPVEMGSDSYGLRPWATWVLAGLVAAASLLALQDLASAIAAWGFVPADALRRGGLTLLSSFFLHADAFHLLVNLYFLVVFGDDVEEAAGWRRLLLLLAVSTVAGNLLHLAVAPRPDVPVIGASGGISGVMGWYALRFPRRRVGTLFFYAVWLRFPALAWVAIWAVLQLLSLTSGEAGVAHGAHLGGFVAGATWRILERAREAWRP